MNHNVREKYLMPAPLLWLGAACIGLYASNKANVAYLKHRDIVEAMPGESDELSTPINGSIVTCGIYGVLDHTGIWFENTIYELSGNGLVRCVSPQRFLGNRSGTKIYVACKPNNIVLANRVAAKRARKNLFNLLDYHLFDQNCHKFVAEMLVNHEVDVTSFSDLNTFLSDFFEAPIKWNRALIST